MIYCTGLNYKTSDIDLRESLSLSEEKRNHLYNLIKNDETFTEVLILSTCNRLEIYGILANQRLKQEEISQDVWWQIVEITKHSQLNFKQDILPKTYTFQGKEALKHIFKVACSLDSLCLGETQITGQFKKAYEESRKIGMLHLFLNRLTRDALILNRKIRNQTSLGKRNKSMSHLAIDLALHIFKTLEHKNFTLIGAGKMISLAYEYALTHKPDSITIVNRTEEKAEQLIRRGTNSRAKGLQDLDKALLNADIVVSSTGSSHFILTQESLKKIQSLRKNKPLFIIDIALPRDIDPLCSQVENVYLFDLDDIRKVVNIKNQDYEKDLALAHELLEERIEIFQTWLEKIESNQTLNSFGIYLNELFQREEERTLRKKDFKHLSKNQKDSIRVMLQSISQKILSDTASSMSNIRPRETETIEIKLHRTLLEKRGSFH
jgi:glutamyl-tRNA reductase